MELTICPKFEHALQVLSKRWNTLIIYELLSGTCHFSEILEATKMSSRVLSERLKELEIENIVERKVIPSKPVVIEYYLTAKGRALEPILDQVSAWASDWHDWQP